MLLNFVILVISACWAALFGWVASWIDPTLGVLVGLAFLVIFAVGGYWWAKPIYKGLGGAG